MASVGPYQGESGEEALEALQDEFGTVAIAGKEMDR